VYKAYHLLLPPTPPLTPLPPFPHTHRQRLADISRYGNDSCSLSLALISLFLQKAGASGFLEQPSQHHSTLCHRSQSGRLLPCNKRGRAYQGDGCPHLSYDLCEMIKSLGLAQMSSPPPPHPPPFHAPLLSPFLRGSSLDWGDVADRESSA